MGLTIHPPFYFDCEKPYNTGDTHAFFSFCIFSSSDYNFFTAQNFAQFLFDFSMVLNQYFGLFYVEKSMLQLVMSAYYF